MKNLFLLLSTFGILFFTSCEKDEITPSSTPALMVKGTAKSHLSASAFVSSNTTGKLGIYAVGAAIVNPPSINLDQRIVNVPYADADGVVYDGERNALYHVNRTGAVLVAIAEVSTLVNGQSVTPSAVGPSTFTSGREASIYNNKVVVADDVTPGKLASYHVNTDQINDFRQYNVGMEVWGLDATSKDLYAVEDVTGNVAFYKDFFKAKSGNLSPTIKVSIQGLVRTHGISYDEHTDVMVLTDIGAASSATDGGIIIITDYSAKMEVAGNGGTIMMSDQIRIYGPATTLGNPVDVAFDLSQGAIFVAERANGGGKFLVFSIPASSGDYAPVYSTNFAGASAVTLDVE